ncbi:unnamed protein product, partial [Didymodactylos carnosus]
MTSVVPSALTPLSNTDSGIYSSARQPYLNSNVVQEESPVKSTSNALEQQNVVKVCQKLTVRETLPTRSVNDIKATVHEPCASKYNAAVKYYNYLEPDLPRKRNMRGGHFILYRIVWLNAIILIGIFLGLSTISKLRACIFVPIIICILYIALSIYNIVIYCLNGNLLESHRMFYSNRISSEYNKFLTVPIQETTVVSQHDFDLTHLDVLPVLKQHYTHLTEVDIMIYNDKYKITVTRAPKFFFGVDIVVFTILLIASIIFAVGVVSK